MAESMNSSRALCRRISAAKFTAYNPESRRISLVLIHGVYHGSWAFQSMIPHLQALGYPVYAVDLRGHAGPDRLRPDDPVGYADYVQDVRRLLDDIPGEKCLIGHSLGGLIALSCAAIPGVESLVLLAMPLPAVLKRKRLSLLFTYPLKSIQMVLKRNAACFYHDVKTAREFFFTGATPESLVEYCMEQIQRQDEPFQLFDDLGKLEITPPSKALSALIVYGELDPTVDQAAAREIQAMIPGPIHCMPGAGHDFLLEPVHVSALVERVHQHLTQ